MGTGRRSGTRRAEPTLPKRERRRLARAERERRLRREALRRRAAVLAIWLGGAAALAGLGLGVRSLGGREAPISAPAVDRVAEEAFRASDGRNVRLADLRGRKVVVFFYEGAGCGACQTQLQQLESQLPELERLGATVVAATTDPVEVSASVAQQLGLSYPILEDRAHLLGSAFGTYVEGGHMGSVDQHSVVVLDEEGRVAWRQIAATTMWVPPEAILSAVEAA